MQRPIGTGPVQIASHASLASIALLVLGGLLGCLSEYDEAFKLNRRADPPGPRSPIIPLVRLENTVELCTNQVDDDGNALADCLDPVCKELSSCNVIPTDPKPIIRENTLERCGNGLDDDGDGPIDCKDSECLVFRICDTVSQPLPIPPENTHVLCFDKVDNDRDGAVDCEDPGCRENVLACRVPEIPKKLENSLALCTDRIDNDADGRTDCDDPDCQELNTCRKIIPDPGPGKPILMPKRIVRIPGDMLEFEDFVEPGIAEYNKWPFVEGEGMRLDKAFYNTPKNLLVYGLILDYPDAGSKDSTGVEFEACHCSDRSGPAATCRVSANFPAGQATSGQYASVSNYPPPWNVCLTFLHASEKYSYVLEVKQKGAYRMRIAGNTAHNTDPEGKPWSATSKGFEIAIDVKDFNLSRNFVQVRAPIVLPNNRKPPSADGAQWFRTVEWDPVDVTFPETMPDQVLLIFESDGHPYNVDYIRFEKLP